MNRKTLRSKARALGQVDGWRFLDMAFAQGFACYLCSRSFLEYEGGAPAEIEHIVPISKGGAIGKENVALACHRCNTRKGRLAPVTFPSPVTPGVAEYACALDAKLAASMGADAGLFSRPEAHAAVLLAEVLHRHIDPSSRDWLVDLTRLALRFHLAWPFGLAVARQAVAQRARMEATYGQS